MNRFVSSGSHDFALVRQARESIEKLKAGQPPVAERPAAAGGE
jgi:hypothetical protein